MDIVFVVLHYKTFRDTVDCIESIKKKIDTESYHIVVVDNASGNGSGEKLQETYKEAKNVTVLLNESNLGFAKGLNTGISYAREKWVVRFIVAINNDTLLISKDFVKTLDEKYEQYEFSVAGPMMITKDGKCSVNPIQNKIRTISEIEKSIQRYRKMVRVCDLHLYGLYCKLQGLKKRENVRTELWYLSDQVNFKLHGACWIFSQKYFEEFEGLDPRTFLYGEEDILFLHVMMKKMKTLYSPDLVIYHKEDSSTNEALPNSVQKLRFVSEKCIESLKIYIEIYKEYQ